MIKISSSIIVLFLFAILYISCKEDINGSKDKTQVAKIFTELTGSETGIDFSNTIVENATFNYLTYEGYYQGAGVGVGDFNMDGLTDIFFAGNNVSDRLYINKGNLRFEDYTSKAGIIQDSSWSTGVAVVDINSDGFPDIYVCKFLYEDVELRRNKLYINRGNGTFIEASKNFGLDNTGYSIQSNFFDYDQDGDLDMYLVNQPPTINSIRYSIGSTIDYRFTDRLFRNDGDSGFKDVTQESGILNFAYGLNATVSDLNHDGYLDIYVTNDFEEADYYYVNNGNGTFTQSISDAFGHISTYSMGSDAGDINNDGLLDLMVVDMASDDHYEQKTNMVSMDVRLFNRLSKLYGLPQYMFNTLQLNRGNNRFSEVAHISGLAYTDWSWSVLFADVDNDMDKDILVTNGIKKEVTFKDVIKNKSKLIKQYKDSISAIPNISHLSPNEFVLSKMPVVSRKNVLFINNGSFSFQKSVYGLDDAEGSITHGAAYADFDNDGDLDMVHNNTDKLATILRNDTRGKNFFRVKLIDDKLKSCPIGAKVYVYAAGQMQLAEVSPIRGYQSTCECTLHFGLDTVNEVDTLKIIWPDQKGTVLKKIKANQVYQVNKNRRKMDVNLPALARQPKALKIGDPIIQNNFDDFKKQRLLPFQLSKIGGRLALSKDSTLVFVPGPNGTESKIYYYSNGSLSEIPCKDMNDYAHQEDMSASFIDFDNDGDDDLFVVTGGNEMPDGHEYYYDRFYLNENGSFRIKDLIPKISQSGLAVEKWDYDEDGFDDLIIGGRYVPEFYGISPKTVLLKNDFGKSFSIDTLLDLGMVTDFDRLKSNLVFSREWGSLGVLDYEKGGFTNTDLLTAENVKGLWQSLLVGDFDKDGDLDILAGNIGLNTKFKASEEFPFSMYVSDFDKDGTNDVYLTQKDEEREYPVRGKQCSSEELNYISKEFQSYEEFAEASIGDLIKIEESTTLQANNLASGVFWNEDPTYSFRALPKIAQLSPILTLVNDWDGIICAGNLYHWEAETSRTDASFGLKLKYQSDKNVWFEDSTEDLNLSGEVSNIQKIDSQNLLVYRLNSSLNLIKKGG